MFDGNTFLPETGIPIRKIACMISAFALADPVPLTVPILKAKSFVMRIADCGLLIANGKLQREHSHPQSAIRNQLAGPHTESEARIPSCPRPPSDSAPRTGRSADRRPRPSP